MRLLTRFFFVLLVGACVFVGWLAWFANSPIPLRAGSAAPIDFTIPSGLGLRGASQQMADAGLGLAPWQFTLLARLMGKSAAIKAGSYEVEPGVTPLGLLNKLTRGDVSQGEVLFVEGMSFRQLLAALEANPDLRHDTARLAPSEILERLGASEKHPEGLFFPDTYLFSKQSSDIDVLKRAYRTMQRQLEREWQRRSVDVPLKTPYEALILASIVEKETGRPADRPMIAAVFTNRLRIGMMLQTDPTVIYGMGEKFGGNLRKRDLQSDTPYNTYTRSGLPPTPIAMPGLAALRAALHPARSDSLYFVARGDGSSEFSRNLDEHNRAVARYQKGR